MYGYEASSCPSQAMPQTARRIVFRCCDTIINGWRTTRIRAASAIYRQNVLPRTHESPFMINHFKQALIVTFTNAMVANSSACKNIPEKSPWEE